MYVGLSGLAGTEADICPTGQRIYGGGSVPPGWQEYQGRGGARCAAPPPPQAAPVSHAGPITVSPVIQTQVSPQISPVFQQAWQPQAPMTAGTTQNVPTSQTSGGPDYSFMFTAQREAQSAAERQRAIEDAARRADESKRFQEMMAAQREQQREQYALLEKMLTARQQQAAPVAIPEMLSAPPAALMKLTDETELAPKIEQAPAPLPTAGISPMLIAGGAGVVLLLLFAGKRKQS